MFFKLSLTEEQIGKIEETVEDATKRATKWGIKILKVRLRLKFLKLASFPMCTRTTETHGMHNLAAGQPIHQIMAVTGHKMRVA